MSKIEDLEKEINVIKSRNKKVEADKAWETSWTRKVVVAVLTYLTIALFLFLTGFPNPFVSAIIPSLGFILSTLSLSFFKEVWLKYLYKK